MSTKTNKSKIKNLVKDMLKESNRIAIQKIERVLNSGSIDLDSWNEDNGKMILPKSIVIAILNSEAKQYSAKGTSFEREVNKNVKNIEYFL